MSGLLKAILCCERPLKGKAVLREAFERQSCATGATSGPLKAILCYEEPHKGKAVLREAFERQSCATGATSGRLKAILCYEGAKATNNELGAKKIQLDPRHQ